MIPLSRDAEEGSGLAAGTPASLRPGPGALGADHDVDLIFVWTNDRVHASSWHEMKSLNILQW